MRPLHSRLRRHQAELGPRPAAARDTRPASPSTPTCRWASRPACPAASAWSRARPARSPTSGSSERNWAKATFSIPTELLHLPIFENVSGTFLELNQKAVVKRRFRAGEIICREGEFGSTAFYILEGKAEVFLASPIAHVKTRGQQQGLFQPADRAC